MELHDNQYFIEVPRHTVSGMLYVIADYAEISLQMLSQYRGPQS